MSKRILIILTILLLLAACGGEDPTPTPEATAVPTATIPPKPTATHTPEPTATPVKPSLVVSDQTLDEKGTVLVDSVTVLEPAWVVVHAERDGQVGEVLGQTAVPSGTTTNVEVTIDPLQATDTMTAMIHINAGNEDTFDFPGVDNPLLEDGSTIAQSFTIDRQMSLPEIVASDQEIIDDGLVRIDSVYSPAPSWVVIHAQEDGGIGSVLGASFVKSGLTEDVVVRIPWREGTPMLYAMLHEDVGREQRFDFPEEDLPLLAVGEPVVAEIQVTYPPHMVIYDQSVINNEIVIERVISDGAGWVVVYADNNDSPGIIIGSVALEDGLNEQVSVGLLGAEVTEQLFIFLHEDTDPGDDFNSAADLQIMYQGRIANPFSFNTNPGNYLGSQDQELLVEDGETAVSIPFTVTEVDAWAVIYTNDDGELGEIIGQTWLPPGINRDVVVVIDPEQMTNSLFAVLHWDAGTTEDFEPLGTDVPFQRNRSIIRSPFNLIQEP